MPRVVHFEFAAEEPERAATFWREAFGWTIQNWPGGREYWLATTGEGEPGIDGAIMPRGGFDPHPGALVTVQVDSVDDTIERIANAGGAILAAKREIPGVGWFVHCRDTEGTLFSVLEPSERPAA